MRPGGADAPALPQAQRVPAGLQTQPALSEHAGHGFLLRNPEGTSAEEIRAAAQMWADVAGGGAEPGGAEPFGGLPGPGAGRT